MGEEGRPQLHAVVQQDEAGDAAVGEERIGIRVGEDSEIPLAVSVAERPPPYPGAQFNRIIENLFEILVLENLIEKYFLVLKSRKDFQ